MIEIRLITILFKKREGYSLSFRMYLQSVRSNLTINLVNKNTNRNNSIDNLCANYN